MRAPCSVWSRVKVITVPIDPRRKPQEIEVGVKVCSVPDPEDAIQSWSVELHTESVAPESDGSHKGLEPDPTAPKEVFSTEVAMYSGALTHIKGRCLTVKGESYMKAVKVPEFLVFLPGDRARVEVRVYRESDAPIPQPSVEVFQEPDAAPSPVPPGLGSSRSAPASSLRSSRPVFALGSSRPLPTRPLGLFY